MKKLMALCLTVLWLLTGCTIVIVDPFATASTQEITTIPTETPTQPTEAMEELTVATEEPTVETEPTIPEGGGLCDTCGLPYAEGEGFEGLCFVCQEKYGPKCSTCGTDCTYRGTIDGMCDECWEKSQARECAQCGQMCLGSWVEQYYVCDICVQMRACPLCGKYYYIWDMFEGVCFDCDDPSGGEADGWDGMCIVCNCAPGDYDGYCYYCHPDFGFTCSECGYNQPYHKTENGLCYDCEQEG